MILLFVHIVQNEDSHENIHGSNLILHLNHIYTHINLFCTDVN